MGKRKALPCLDWPQEEECIFVWTNAVGLRASLGEGHLGLHPLMSLGTEPNPQQWARLLPGEPSSGAEVGHGGSRGAGCKCSHQQNFWQRETGYRKPGGSSEGSFIPCPEYATRVRLKSSPLTSTAAGLELADWGGRVGPCRCLAFDS